MNWMQTKAASDLMVFSSSGPRLTVASGQRSCQISAAVTPTVEAIRINLARRAALALSRSAYPISPGNFGHAVGGGAASTATGAGVARARLVGSAIATGGAATSINRTVFS